MTREELKRREPVSIGAVAEAIKSAMPDLNATDQQIATAIHRLMSRGAPVEPAAVGKAVGVAADQVERDAGLLARRVQGRQRPGGRLLGHSVQQLDPEYRLIFKGKTTHAWCALDTLFIPGIIGWVSMVIPDGPFGYDVIESFCHRVLFFASEETGRRWIAEHNGTTLLPIEKAFELGRVLTERIVSDPAATS